MITEHTKALVDNLSKTDTSSASISNTAADIVNKAQSSALTDDLSSSSVTPLACTHLAQKHYYSSNYYDHSHPQIENKPASLAVEAAVAIVINSVHYAVLMASPYQLEYLAVGFLFSEGLIQYSHELLDWEVTQLTDMTSYESLIQGSTDKNSETDIFEQSEIFEQSLVPLQDYDVYIVELVLNQRCHQRIQAQKRQLAGRTGCGMCGITGLTQALPDLSFYHQEMPQTKSIAPHLNYLLQMRQKIDAMQHTHQLTGAVHAAATMQGDDLHLFEDVGRHNALDKLIGWQLRNKVDVECVLMTSRLSIELVQKSIRSRIPWLVGMSAPTSTAVRVAERYGLGLAGFLRDNRVTYYTGI